ncbi:aryl-alcohol dehydrogenase [Aspergillus saccharolyticus JOP 1030-1]|uniref:Aryl-alcohol dehydrogenase n=1 Tax=Aspergillus saccharolyticus JOP 1030-1 TaxID=1450539 RepID=A0A318Z5Q2_9EURO|nr:aryl-alcohol dehydrogenase [Aspergillus saccharolyticus JOP 1030-1]PYH42446.1 aryl-alcohol dehydrogenase [Aspergillus saccharolyticus JOP 1030-1]
MDSFAPAPPPPTPLGRYRTLSSTAGIRVSPFQLGAMSIGSAWSGGLGAMDQAAAFALLDAYVAAGGNFIDTANNYQNEESERWIGEWMAARGGIRDHLVLATKYTGLYKPRSCSGSMAATDERSTTTTTTPPYPLPLVNFSGNHRRSLHLSLHDSLTKLRTSYIDILYVHWWDSTCSIEEIMDSLHTVIQQGKVMYLGICNAPAWVVSAANTYARLQGKTPFSIYQGRWNVLHRDLEREVLPMARRFGMAVAPWDVLGGGKFQTAEAMAARRKRGESLRTMMGGDGGQTEEEVRMSEALSQVAKEHGMTSVTAVALAYVLAKAPNVFPVVGGRKVEHLMENLQGLELRLTEAQIRFLEGVRPLELGFPQNMLGEEPGVSGREGRALANAGVVDFVKNERPIGYA